MLGSSFKILLISCLPLVAIASQESFVDLVTEDGTKFAAWIPPTSNTRNLKKKRGGDGKGDPDDNDSNKGSVSSKKKPPVSSIVMTMVNISPIEVQLVDRQLRDDAELTVEQEMAFHDAVAEAKEYAAEITAEQGIRRAKGDGSGKKHAKSGKSSKGSLQANFARGKSFGEKDKVVTSLQRFSTSTVIVPQDELLCIGSDSCIKTAISVDHEKTSFNPMDPARRYDPKNDKFSLFPGGLEGCEPDEVEKTFQLDAALQVAEDYRRLTGRHFTDIHAESFSLGTVQVPLWPLSWSDSVLQAHDDTMNMFNMILEPALMSPRAFEVKPFVSSKEAEELLQAYGGSNVAHVIRGNSRIGDRMMERASQVLQGWDRFKQGRFFGAHGSETEYFEIHHMHSDSPQSNEEYRLVPKHEYKRFATLFVVLKKSDDLEGGELRLPHCDSEQYIFFAPAEGNGALLYNMLPDGNFDLASISDAMPVKKGSLWVAKFIVPSEAVFQQSGPTVV